MKIILQVQFIITGVHAIIALLAKDCNFPKFVIMIAIPQDIFMFMLFWDFYKKAYRQPKNKLK